MEKSWPGFAWSQGLIIARGQWVWATWSEPFVSDTSPKCIDQEGLGRRLTGTRQDPGKGRSLIYPSSHGRTKFAYTSYTENLAKFGCLPGRVTQLVGSPFIDGSVTLLAKPVPGSEKVGSEESRKREHENFLFFLKKKLSEQFMIFSSNVICLSFKILWIQLKPLHSHWLCFQPFQSNGISCTKKTKSC